MVSECWVLLAPCEQRVVRLRNLESLTEEGLGPLEFREIEDEAEIDLGLPRVGIVLMRPSNVLTSSFVGVESLGNSLVIDRTHRGLEDCRGLEGRRGRLGGILNPDVTRAMIEPSDDG